MSEKKEVELKVAEAQQDDVGKGIVRLDSQIMKEIGVNKGDVVEIEGESKTSAIVDRCYPADIGLKIIRMDGYTRFNAGKAGVGEYVKVRKAEVSEAKRITLAPAQKNVNIRIPESILKRNLLGRVVTRRDIISLGGTKKRRSTLGSSSFADIFSILADEDFFPSFPGMLREVKFVVTNTSPSGHVYISDLTQISLSKKPVSMRETKMPEITYEDIGGLKEEVKKIREMVELPLKHPEVFKTLGIEPPKGLLLYGPPGTGKTLLAKAVAAESDAHFISLNGPEVMSKWVGQAEKKLRKLFDEAEENAPSIIFIDEIDAIASKRKESVGEVERRVVAQLLALMDGMKARGKVIVIAATNRHNALDPALRRPGRFDREIEIGVPNTSGRLEILKIHTRNMPLLDDVNLDRLASQTFGFVGADIEALCKEAAMAVLRRVIPEISWDKDEGVSAEILDKLKVGMDDFRAALRNVRPSAMREVLVQIPDIRWKDVGGLEEVKQELKESVEWPIKNPKSFQKLGIIPPKGLLLYGPPGSGKTLLAKAVAHETEMNFINVKGPELLSKWVGESEKAVRETFKKARQVSPCIIFFDEIDSLAPRRGRSMGSHVTEQVVNQILTELDGLEELHNVVVIAATNRPDIVDSALLRPGRIDRLIMVPPPGKKAREEIFKVHTRNMPLNENIDLKKLAEKTEDYSGADIEAVCREAGMLALREDMNAKIVKKNHFEKALKKIKPSINEKELNLYKTFSERYQTKDLEKPAKAPNYVG